MRIINAKGGQYDYFDYAVPFVADDDVVLDRRNVFKVRLETPPDGIGYAVLSDFKYEHYINVLGVGFCGTLYLYFGYKSGTIDPRNEAAPYRIVYADSIDELETKTEPLPRIERARLARMISIFHKSTKYESLFVQNETPLFFFAFDNCQYSNKPDRTDWVLRDVKFDRIFEPTQAYQAIEWYIANVLNNKQDAPVELSNESKLKKAGFNEFSFKRPTKI